MQGMDKPPSKSTAREITEAAVVGGVGAVPVVGSPLAAAFALALGWSYNRRMTAWLEDLAEAVDELQQQGTATLEDLVDDDVFLDAVALATRAAQATHQQEKLAALRNGVLHSVGPDAPRVDEQARFFRLLDELGPAHLLLLELFADPPGFYAARGIPMERSGFSSNRSQLIERGIPEMQGRSDWYALLFADLTAAAMLNGSLGGMLSADGMWQPIATPLGQRFLAFISGAGAYSRA